MWVPEKIQVVEVGPRDGFQNIKELIPTEVKLKVIETMIGAGVSAMEITSFVHPKAIPQMFDSTEVAKHIVQKYGNQEGFRAIALVPNLRGVQNAYASGIREVTYVISVSEKHSQANVNRMPEESLADLKNIISEIPDLKIRLDVATAFGCPFQGRIGEQAVLDLVGKAVDTGVKEVILCDTIGVAHPIQVKSLSEKAKNAFPGTSIGLHMHNTRGMGLANTLAGMEAGITLFETTVGGLGGCPFAPGAAGNTATEDMVNMLQYMGVETGIQLDEYLKAVYTVRDKIQDNLTSNMAKACKYENI